jgi:CRP/FNR family cyclic AMP-dependent transcriptional regulator
MAIPPKAFAPKDCQHCELRPSSAFCNLSPTALADYNLIGSIRTALPGTILFHEDGAADQVLVVCSGRVKLWCESQSGRILNLKLAGSGDVLGLSAILSGTKHETSAEVIHTSFLKAISREQFLGFLRHNAEGSLHAAQRLSEDYKLALHGARRLALSESAPGRIASILLDWGRAACCSKTPMRFVMTMSHGDLAEFAGTSRETVTRTLAKLQKDKTIAVHGATIHILLPTKMAELAA